MEQLDRSTFTYDMAKRKFCAFVVSNSNANGIRRDFFETLSEYKKVDSGGRYLNNVGGAVKDKIEFCSQHKFTIAFENTNTLSSITTGAPFVSNLGLSILWPRVYIFVLWAIPTLLPISIPRRLSR